MSNGSNNPFKFGSDIAKGEYFADREKERKQLKSQLKDGARVVIYSARRYGKTALISNTLDELEKEGHTVAYLDVSTAPGKSLFVSKYRSLFVKAGTKQWFIDWVKTNLPRIKISLGDAAIDFSGLSDADINDAFDKIIDLPQQLGSQKKRVIVALDEFHEIRNLDSVATENLLRSKFQFHDRVSYVFSGSKSHVLQDMFETAGNPFYKSARMVELQRIPNNEYSEFISHRFKKTGIQIDADMLSEILSETDSHTYYTQQLCHELWDVCRVEQRSVVRKEDVSTAIDQVVLNQSAVYDKIWDDLSPGYKKLIIGLLQLGGNQIWSLEFRRETRLSVGALQKGLKYATDQYLVEKSGKSYHIPDLFFREWLSRKLR